MYNSVIFTEVTDNIDSAKPLGAYKCAHSLREAGYTCLVVDCFHSFTSDELLQLIDQVVGSDTYLVGFSNTFLTNSNVEKNPDGSTPPYPLLTRGTIFPQGSEVENKIISAIKQKNHNIKISVGGARSNPNEQNPNIDYVFIGYSEISIVNLMDHLTQGHPLNKAQKNIWGITIIDDRKAEGYDFANSTMTWLPTDVVNAKVLPLEVARGCIFKCKFCAYPMNGKQQLDFIRRPELIQYEMEKNYEEYGIFRYQFVDDTFNDNEHKLDLMLKVIKKLKFQPEFWAYTRLDLIARNVDKNFSKLYDLGLRSTFFGIETLNETAGKIVGKGYSRQRQIEAVQRIRQQYGNQVALHGNFIIGLPGEDEASCRQTLNVLCSQELPLHSWWFSPLVIQKNNMVAWTSEFGTNYEKFGYMPTAYQDEFSVDLTWTSPDWNSEKVVKVANEFNNCSAAMNVMTMGWLGWSMLNLGYEPKFITETTLGSVNWNQIETRKQMYMKYYKRKLFGMLGVNCH